MTSTIKVDNIASSGGTQLLTAHSSGFIVPKAGGIIQMQYDQYTGTSTQALSADTDTTLDNLSVSITPTSTSSIIKIEAQLLFEYSNSNEYDSMFFFYRGTTKLSHPTAGSRNNAIASATAAYHATDADSTPNQLYMTYFDAPSTTSAITYKIGASFYGAGTLYFNRSKSDIDSGNYERGVSLISVMEIAG